ncbi:hypothetical protein BZA05DRAFT_415550 [Tricharina praecox]|uniref:uncharacterized protein n=1 Tax=Tricharina praecox TaxID=43433 RepID=UPI00221E98D0|nr:uncharacterized protein BZA05DRAFT_415550 [Tricharina praecox]KAI5856825.1 hypothetical protein BZA05DRAFT_415550 [Tricharina praecox]
MSSQTPPRPHISSGLLDSIKHLPPLISLTDEHFPRWSLELKQILKVVGLWQYVIGKTSDNRLSVVVWPFDNIVDEIRCKRLQASGLILMAMKPELRKHFTNERYDDPTELWTSLKSLNVDVMKLYKIPPQIAIPVPVRATPAEVQGHLAVAAQRFEVDHWNAMAPTAAPPTVVALTNQAPPSRPCWSVGSVEPTLKPVWIDPSPKNTPSPAWNSPSANPSSLGIPAWDQGRSSPAVEPVWDNVSPVRPAVSGSPAAKPAWDCNSPAKPSSPFASPVWGSIHGSINAGSIHVYNSPATKPAWESSSAVKPSSHPASPAWGSIRGSSNAGSVHACNSPAWDTSSHAKPSSPFASPACSIRGSDNAGSVHACNSPSTKPAWDTSSTAKPSSPFAPPAWGSIRGSSNAGSVHAWNSPAATNNSPSIRGAWDNAVISPVRFRNGSYCDGNAGEAGKDAVGADGGEADKWDANKYRVDSW